MNLSRPNSPLWLRRAMNRCDQLSLMHRLEVEATTEPISERAETSGRVFLEIEAVIHAV